MHDFKSSVGQAVQFLKNMVSQPIDTAIILGSGLSDLSLQQGEEIHRISYEEIPGLVKSTAPSHAGELRVIKLMNHAGVERFVALCAGRQHLYEGYSAQQVCILVYVLKQLGCNNLIITNAAGALNPAYRPGDVMLLDDHINLTGQNPLIGQDESFGMRFPDMSEAYQRSLLEKAKQKAQQHQISCHQGVYAGVTGPSLETSAERRMMRMLGADAVGMSTVMEVIAANHCGMNVLGMSAITNLALGDKDQQPDTIEEVLENAMIAGRSIKKIIVELLTK